jgi:hypothetical protein
MTSNYINPKHYSTARSEPPVLTGYSTPVLHKDAAVSYEDTFTAAEDTLKDRDGSDVDYFPVLDSTPPPSTREEEAAKKGAKVELDAAALAEELMVRQKVAALLASLPSAKSRQRVAAQLKGADDSEFEVIEPSKPIKQEKEWAKVGQGRQWNEEYQRVVGKGLKQLVSDDVRLISRLSHDFVKQAELYAKIIINEVNVPDAWCVTFDTAAFLLLSSWLLWPPSLLTCANVTAPAVKRSSQRRWEEWRAAPSTSCRASSSSFVSILSSQRRFASFSPSPPTKQPCSAALENS